MSDIKLYDFAKNVEMNRRKLIQNIRQKGGEVQDFCSLSQVVDANNDLAVSGSHSTHPGQHEVRWFDGDGTLLKTEWVEHGGTVTPPEQNPNLDPQRLTFKKWVSAICRYDNITHDVDYGATYTINDHGIHLFCVFNEHTGLNPQLQIQTGTGKDGTITVNWGDGKYDEFQFKTYEHKNASHTYEQPGEYEIVITSDERALVFYLNSSSNTRLLGSNTLDNALVVGYFPMLTAYNTYLTKSLKYLILERSSTNYIIDYCQNIVFPNNFDSYSSSIYFKLYNTRMIILEGDLENHKFNISSFTTNYHSALDKLIIPSLYNEVTFGNINNGISIICYSDVISSFGSTEGLKSLILLGKVTSLPSMNSCYNLQEFVFPDSVSKFNGNIAPSSLIKSLTVPADCQFSSSPFSSAHALQHLNLYDNFDYPINTMYCYSMLPENLINWLNWVKDNTGLPAKAITLPENLKSQIFIKYAKFKNGFWEECARTDKDGMLLVEAFNSKNWTVS